MTSLPIFGTDARFLLQPLLTLMVAGGVGISMLFYFWKKQQHKSVHPSPPLCSAGILETISAISNNRIGEFMLEHFYKIGGIFRLRLPIPGHPMVIVVASPADARAILNDSQSIKPMVLYKTLENFAGGIVNIASASGGHACHHRRNGMKPAFAAKHVNRMNETVLAVSEDWVKEKLGQLKKNNDPNAVVSIDVGKEMIFITLSILCQSAFEYDITDSQKLVILEEIRLAWGELTLKSAMNPLRQFATWILPARQRAFLAVKCMQDFALGIITSYKTNPSPIPDTVIDLIMKNSNYKNDLERAADIIMILFAGHDTTGFTMSFALLELAKNPSVQNRLRAELAKGSEGDDYLRAVVKETMRVHPIVPVTGFRSIGRDFVTEEGGYFLPKNSVVFIAAVAMLQDPSLFQNPMDFEPSRWFDATEAAKQAFFPFAVGQRNCPGQSLANAELHTLLVRLIQEFEFTLEQEGTISTPVTLRIDNCYLKVSRTSK